MKLQPESNFLFKSFFNKNKAGSSYFKLSGGNSVTRLELYKIIEEIPFPIIITDSENTIIHANVSALCLTGYSILAGIPITKILPVESDIFYENEKEKLNFSNSKTLLCRKNSELMPVYFSKSSLDFRNKKFTVINLFSADETDKNNNSNNELRSKKSVAKNNNKSKEKETGASNEGHVKIKSEPTTGKFELVFEGLSDSVFILDMQGKFIEVNQKTSDRLGYSKEQLMSMNLSDTLTSDCREKLQINIENIKQSRNFLFEAEQLSSSGTVIPVEINACKMELSGENVIVCSARNISLRKKFEGELITMKEQAKDNEKELNVIFNSSASPLLLINKNFEVLRINATAISNFNIGSGELTNKRIGDVINCIGTKDNTQRCGFTEKCTHCQLFQVIEQSVKSGKLFDKEEIELNNIEAGEVRTRTVNASIKPLIDTGNGKFLVTLDDITESKLIEKELTIARQKAEESDRLKTVFLNNLSHELRTPLNGIMGFSELLINSESLKDIRQFAELINRSGKRLLNVIEDLFMVSSIISKSVRIEPKKIKLSEFIDDVKIMLHDEYMSFSNQNVALDFNISNKLNGQQVIIDPSIYMLVIKKLARNAFKFTPSGNVEFGLFDLNSKGITLYIKDTGIGIDPSKQELIFHYFRQGDENLTRLYGGTGTGLSISKSLIELSNGKIWVNSAPGKGSVFYFTMPVNNGHPAVNEYASEKYKINADNLLDGKNVLIVEDDNFNFLLLDAFLYGTGAKVIHAKTGEEAISAVEKNRNIDLVLMDLRMPDISGFEVTRKLKKLNPAIPIIAQSALTMPEDIEKALMAGCDEYIAKPMTNASLMEKIAMVLK